MNTTATHVLLCEDDPFYSEAISLLLSKNGYRITVVANGNEGLDLLRSEGDFGLILCGIVIPGLDGFGVLRAVKADEQLKRIPFIFLTTVSDSQSMERAQELGADDYFIKVNAGLSHLVELIRKHVE